MEVDPVSQTKSGFFGRSAKPVSMHEYAQSYSHSSYKNIYTCMCISTCMKAVYMHCSTDDVWHHEDLCV